jgi:hypothetical protein
MFYGGAMKRIIHFALSIIWVGISFAQPPIIQDTAKTKLPVWINEAILLGQKKGAHPYSLANKIFGIGGDEGSFTTPFLRVAIAATEAKKKLMIFGPSDVTEEMLAPVLIVKAYPLFGEKYSDSHRGAEHVVIKKCGSKDPADAIQPISIKPYDETHSTSGGGIITKQGLEAIFPLDAFKEGYEFFFLYEEASGTGNKFYFSITKKIKPIINVAT